MHRTCEQQAALVGGTGSASDHDADRAKGAAARTAVARSRRRFVLLAGTARSGTSWLGNILNSSPRSVYSHEPLIRFPEDQLQDLLDKVRETGCLSANEREAVLDHWSHAFCEVRRPPFFRKDYSLWPPKVVWSAWLSVTAAKRGYRLFQSLFSPAKGASYDLVAKQGGWESHESRFVQALAPDMLIVILRHPYGVIASLRRGKKLGLMGSLHRDKWLQNHEALSERLGYARREVIAMTDAEFESLCWLVENDVYQRVLDEHPSGHTVVYRDLVHDPLKVTQSLFDVLGWEVTRQTVRFLDQTSKGGAGRLTSALTARHKYFSVYQPAKGTIESWKRELSRREQEEILAIARPLVDRYWPEGLDEST